MKILQLVTSRQYRGAEVFASNLSMELIKLGHEVIFIGLYKNDINILEVPGADNNDLVEKKEGTFSIQVVRELRKTILESKPDVIQCNGSDTLKYMVAVSYLIPKTPVLYRNISMISEWVPKGPKRQLYKKFFSRISHVSSVGAEAIDDFIRTFGYPREQTSVIRRGIPLKEVDGNFHSGKLRTELGLKSTDKIVMHIGNFSSEKNHEFLLDIFKDIKEYHPEIKLVCVGNGILFDTITNEIKSRKLQSTVYLLGFRKDIPEVLSASDCFVLASKVEGVPGVILEAGTQKKPSIATNVGGVSEVLIDGHTGFLIENFNKKVFVEKLLEVLLNDSLRMMLGENAYQMVLNDFNPLQNAQKFEALYDKLILQTNSGKGF
jgi:glycosyltransferase involved in cell wall biosynthesis